MSRHISSLDENFRGGGIFTNMVETFLRSIWIWEKYFWENLEVPQVKVRDLKYTTTAMVDFHWDKVWNYRNKSDGQETGKFQSGASKGGSGSSFWWKWFWEIAVTCFNLWEKYWCLRSHVRTDVLGDLVKFRKAVAQETAEKTKLLYRIDILKKAYDDATKKPIVRPFK